MIPPAVMLIAVPIMMPLNFATELRWRTDERIRRWARVAAVLDLERRFPRHVWQDQGWDPVRHRPAPDDRYDPMTAGPTEEQL